MSETVSRRSRSRADFVNGGANATATADPTTASSDSHMRGEVKPLDLMNYSGPLYVQNKTKTVISHDDGQGNTLTVGPSTSNDAMAMLPLPVAKHPGFQKLWRQGKVLVSADPAMEEALTLAELRSDEKERLRLQAASDSVTVEEDPNKKALFAAECIECGERLFRTEKELKETAPLCDIHEDHAAHYVNEQYIDAEDGNKVKTRWVEIG